MKKLSLLLIAALLAALIAFYCADPTPKREIEKVLKSYGLTDISVEIYPHHLEVTAKESTHYHSTDITCQGFSHLSNKQKASVFTEIDSLGTPDIDTDQKYVTIYSDNKTYAYTEKN